MKEDLTIVAQADEAMPMAKEELRNAAGRGRAARIIPWRLARGFGMVLRETR